MSSYVPGISVILSTWNRAESLRQTLESYTRLRPPSLDWELIVVDNNSTDHTREVIASFEKQLPIVYQKETRPGQCEARNCGIRHSRYELNIFSDNDVTVAESWLYAYAEALQAHPEASYFGGPIELDLSTCRIPAWASDEKGQLHYWFAGQLGLLNLEQMTRLGMTRPESPTWMFYGGNMAFRRELFDQFGMFDPRLGHTGKRRFASEEAYFQKQLYQAGKKPYYVPDALLYHRIRQDELTFRSRWQWSISRGRGAAVMAYLLGEDKKYDYYRTRRLIKALVTRILKLPLASSFERAKTICDLASMVAYNMQMLQMEGESQPLPTQVSSA